MGKPVSSDVKRVETTALNTKVNKEVFQNFKDCCAYLGYPMNVMLETFMRQYADGEFKLDSQADFSEYDEFINGEDRYKSLDKLVKNSKEILEENKKNAEARYKYYQELANKNKE